MYKIVFVFLMLVSFSASSQTWQWGRRGGGSAGLNNRAEQIVDMATDKNGNVYMLAQLDGGGDENIGNGNGDSTMINTWGGRDAVLVSYDCSGKIRWMKVFGCDLDDKAIGMSMDSLGHIYVLVQTNRNFNVDIDSFVANSKRKSIGLIQYDTIGHFKWFRQPNPDTVGISKNIGEYGGFNISTTPDGDTYICCGLGTGLIAGTTNLAASTSGTYMLKYTVAGVPKELIKLDIKGVGSATSYTDFSVTKSRKFIFNLSGYYLAGDTLFIGGQVAKYVINTVCFSSTGNMLWRVENKDTIAGRVRGRPYIDEDKGLIYVCGGGIWGTQKVDTLGGIAIINQGTEGFLPFIASLDTLGVFKQIKWGSCYRNISNFLNSLVRSSDGRIFVDGFGGGIVWDGFKFDGGSNLGVQTVVSSFDATTLNMLSIDSLRGSSSYTLADVIAADNKNNIYVGGQLSNNIKVGSQTLLSAGGQSDFFIAKYGTNNCGLVPLKFISYAVVSKNEKAIENIWQTANEINVSLFNVQRSINGKDFENIGTVMAKNKANNIYSFTDNNTPTNTTIYYRLQSIDYDGQVQYSDIKRIDVTTQKNEIKIYPNPATDYIMVTGGNIKEIQIIDCLGRILTTQKSLSSGSNLINLASIKEGIYLIKVIDTSNIVSILKFVKE